MTTEYTELEKLVNDSRRPMLEKLIAYNIAKSVLLWQKKYNMIKDSSWPSCATFEEFANLPAHIQNECIEVHHFSPDIWKQHIINDADLKFVLPPKLYSQKILNANKDLIINKDIVDFACNYGDYSFASCQLGAKSVVGFDIRDDNLTIANAVQKFLKIPQEQLTFVKMDIHDHAKITELCTNKDTALVPGIMYHIHDHYEVLLAIAKANVNYIIIETGENKEIAYSAEPLVWWRTEHTFENIAGWFNKCSNVPVGYPNRAWFNLIADQLGYELVSSNYQEINSSKNHPDEFTLLRGIHVLKKL